MGQQMHPRILGRWRPAKVAAFLVFGLLALPTVIAAPAGAATVEYTYSINSKGVIASPVGEFGDVVADTLADPRGWSLGGSIRFRRVDTGGSFRLWLTANALVPSFGGPCTTFYSCQPGQDIVINEDRWRTGSPYWPGPVGEYRHMVLNHEIGHWLGLNHVGCSGTAALAPIMMQQSKGVGACRPNPWPLPSERSRVAAARGVSVVITAPVPVVTGIAAWPNAGGFRLSWSDGKVTAAGGLTVRAPGGSPDAPVVGIAPAAGDDGWIVAADGDVIPLGGAPFLGSMGGRRLVAPVVGMAPAAVGRGYRLVASDGGVFAFGNAPFAGSLGGQRPDAPVSGMAAAAAGGYWLVTAAGDVAAFGAVGGAG